MNNKCLIFAGRNVKELMRSPVSWGFGLALPIAIFVIMQAIIKSIGDVAAQAVPMFAVERFTGGVLIFGASFLSLFAAMLISGDRDGSFITRLYSSPMRSVDYIIGYMLSLLPIAGVQVLVSFVTALIFGLPFSGNIFAAMVFSIIFSLTFIAIGVIFGSAMSSKSAPPVCSAVVQVAALLSGMWFDLDMIGGGFSTFCHILPFAHCYDLIRYTIAGEWGNVWLPALVISVYLAVLIAAAVLVFRRSSERA